MEERGQKNVKTGTFLKKLRGRVRADVALAVVAVAVGVILSAIYEDQGKKVYKTSLSYLKEMITILPAVLILMGLFTVWVKRDTVVRLLGKGSGIPGILLAILLGTLPTGPLYIAFPLAAALLNKGARTATVMAFLSAWACIKIPQELMELQFLGARFMAVRLALTVILLIPAVLIGESIYGGRGLKRAVIEKSRNLPE